MERKNSKDRSQKKKVLSEVISVTVLIIGVLGSLWGFRMYRGSTVSEVILSPLYSVNREIPDEFYEDYLQNDRKWADDMMGDSSDTMARSGCLTCCIAASLNVQGLGEFTPKELNGLFSEKKVYNSQGAILWNELEQAVPPAKAVINMSVSNKSINDALKDGLCPIVKVRTKNGVYHWVVLMESNMDTQEFYCVDPLRGKASLADYGNKVYGVRVVMKR